MFRRKSKSSTAAPSAERAELVRQIRDGIAEKGAEADVAAFDRATQGPIQRLSGRLAAKLRQARK